MQTKSTTTGSLELRVLCDGQQEVRQMFSAGDISWLRNALLDRAFEFDSWRSAEIMVTFLRLRGYGVSYQAARTSISRLEATNCREGGVAAELEKLALAN